MGYSYRSDGGGNSDTNQEKFGSYTTYFFLFASFGALLETGRDWDYNPYIIDSIISFIIIL